VDDAPFLRFFLLPVGAQHRRTLGQLGDARAGHHLRFFGESASRAVGFLIVLSIMVVDPHGDR
jgi:hypothetical protein